MDPLVTICIPHWQVRSLASICLRSLRHHTDSNLIEIQVVDNGSKDESLDWLRSLSWIKLIERPEESPANWPLNVFTAWDLGIQIARGKFFITMHTDVIIKRNDWLELFLKQMEADRNLVAIGGWKLDLESPFYVWQKHLLGQITNLLKRPFGRKSKASFANGRYPRDYCAMYRKSFLLENQLTFRPIHGQGGGYSIAKQIWDCGGKTSLIPVPTLATRMIHVAHGTAAIAAEKPLNHARAQRKVERKVAALFNEPWIQELRDNHKLDLILPIGVRRPKAA